MPVRPIEPTSPRAPIHIINPLWDACGGSERRAVSLYSILKDHADVYLWSKYKPDPVLAARFPIYPIRFRQRHFPSRGVVVFVGVYFDIGQWLRYTRPQRKIVVVNTIQHDVAPGFVAYVESTAGPPVELVFPSQTAKMAYGMAGTIEPSPIDIAEFSPALRPDNDRFTVGRLSRDHPTKHHADDPAFYRLLIEHGCAVHVMGGQVLADRMKQDASPHLTLLPAGAQPAARFLQGLDCFYYRTADDWFEAYGRVVFEAMACGLPVVACRKGGYAEHIEHGVNGFLFDSEKDALDIILRLKADAGLRAQISTAARQSAERIYAPAELENIKRFYLQDGLMPAG